MVSQWVNGETRCGVLSSSNDPILSIRFKSIKPILNLWEAVSQTGELKLYDQSGTVICGVDADSLSPTNTNNYLYSYKDGKVGLLTTSGTEISPPGYVKIDKIDRKWMATPYPTWEVIQGKDTLHYIADSIRIWNNGTLIKGYRYLYYLEKNNERKSQTYNSIRPTNDNLAITQRNKSFGVISISGRVILPTKFQDVYETDGLLYAKQNNHWSLYDSLGTKKTVFTYDSIGTATEGLFPILRKGKWGFMNRQGVEVIHCIYDTPAVFKNGKSVIRYFGREGIIDLEGNWVVKPLYNAIIDYSYDFYIARLEEQYFVKSYLGEIIYFSTNPIVIENGSFKEIKPEDETKTYVGLSSDEDNWNIIFVNGKYGFEGPDGLLKVTYRYDSLLPYYEGLAAFKLRGKWGFIDRYEQIVVQPRFSEVSSFSNGLSKVKKEGNYGLIDKRGTFVLKPNYDDLKHIKNKVWLATQQDKKGLYNERGAVILHPLLDNIIYISDEMIIVVKNNKYGVVDSNGASILPRIYDFIGYDSDHNALLLKRNPEKQIRIH